jgi:HipA-like protein
MRKAHVYCREILAGVLSNNDASDYYFQYTPEYLTSYPPISLSFPKRPSSFDSPILFPYFFGLLAEGDDKALQCRMLKIDEEDHFTRLLKTCETETIGGVTIKEIEEP